MRVTIRLHNKEPIEIDGAWQIRIELRGRTYEVTPQMVDRDVVERIALKVSDPIGDRLHVVPLASNGILFGGGK